jgi:hypothetical protein
VKMEAIIQTETIRDGHAVFRLRDGSSIDIDADHAPAVRVALARQEAADRETIADGCDDAADLCARANRLEWPIIDIDLTPETTVREIRDAVAGADANASLRDADAWHHGPEWDARDAVETIRDWIDNAE